MVHCTFVVAGVLDPVHFGDAFEGLTVTPAGGTTELSGELIDQAQVQGVLRRLYDLGIEVLSFTSTTSDGQSPG
jgi:hypothetical protein